jgi:hypothetical protein
MQDAEAIQRIAGAVTPAVMVSACGLLALGLDNQAARMSGRLRELVKEFRACDDGARADVLRREARVLSKRHGLYVGALLTNYAALLAFVLTSATALWLGGSQDGRVFVVGLFGLGVLLLAATAICTLLSVRMSREAILLEERGVVRDSKGVSIRS